MNDQEALWQGDFGAEYTARQRHDLHGTQIFFSRALTDAVLPIKDILEFGAGSGHNLAALRKLYKAHLTGVEINEKACEDLSLAADTTVHGSILDFAWGAQWDLVFTKGLLIHIHPENIPAALKSLYSCSRKYILICEYHSPRYETVLYRGEEMALWKGPYAEQMLDTYPDLALIDYGFWSRRDPFPQDDINWWLLEKNSGRERRASASFTYEVSL
jgi:spore coat polysaccharide biosynthesis protein SpsF